MSSRKIKKKRKLNDRLDARDELCDEVKHLVLKIGDLDRTLLRLEEKRVQMQDDITRLRSVVMEIDDLRKTPRAEFRKSMRLDIGIGCQPTGLPLSEPPRSKSVNIPTDRGRVLIAFPVGTRLMDTAAQDDECSLCTVIQSTLNFNQIRVRYDNGLVRDVDPDPLWFKPIYPHPYGTRLICTSGERCGLCTVVAPVHACGTQVTVRFDDGPYLAECQSHFQLAEST